MTSHFSETKRLWPCTGALVDLNNLVAPTGIGIDKNTLCISRLRSVENCHRPIDGNQFYEVVNVVESADGGDGHGQRMARDK